MRKRLAVILCTAVIGMSLAGCGGQDKTADTGRQETQEQTDETKVQEQESEEPEDKQEEQAAGEPLRIEFFQQKGEEGPQKGYQAIIDKFNAENPDIVIEMNTVPDAPTVLTSRISSGDIPVIFSDFPTQVAFRQKVANGYIQDLTGQPFLDNVEASSLELAKQEDGGYYALSYSRSFMGVYYNRGFSRSMDLRYLPHGTSFWQSVTRCRRQESHRWDCMARIRAA